MLKTYFQKPCRGCRLFIILIFLTCAFLFSLAVYTCGSSYSCFGVNNMTPTPLSDYDAFLQGKLCKHKFNNSILDRRRKLNLEGNDVLVYLHMQKTGGATFGRHLVHNLDLDSPCQCTPGVKKCTCLTQNKRIWLFSRHSTGWQCGLHADWTELSDCVDEWFKTHDVESRKYRKYHYVTFLRNPVDRFLSEWQHVQRGATWKAARLHCNGRTATLEEVPFCYEGIDWQGVTFDEFISCKYNLAFNRMTRMLANLSLVNCYNRTGMSELRVGEILLKSAKENLLDFAFFGIVEEQQKTQFLFEKTFGLRFIDNLEQKEETHVGRLEVTNNMTARVIAKNRPDIDLYQYAKDLFFQRVTYLENVLGYTVHDYFDHIRDSEEDSDLQEVGIDQYDDLEQEDVDEEGDEDGDKIKAYPSKSSVRHLVPTDLSQAILKNNATNQMEWRAPEPVPLLRKLPDCPPCWFFLRTLFTMVTAQEPDPPKNSPLL